MKTISNAKKEKKRRKNKRGGGCGGTFSVDN